MPTMPQCKQPEPKVNTFFQDIWFILVRMFQIIYFFTVGAIVFLFVLIAVECVFTGRDFFKLFR